MKFWAGRIMDAIGWPDRFHTITVLTLLATAERAICGAPSMEVICDRHRAAVQAIHSLKCDVELQRNLKDGDIERSTARYMRSGEDVFVRWQHEGSVRECVVQGQVLRNISTRVPKANGGADPGSGSLNRYDGEEVTLCDIWAKGLLHLPIPNEPKHQPLDRFLREATRVSQPRVEKGGLVLVDFNWDRPGMVDYTWTGTLTFDPSANWLVRAVSYTGHKKTGGRPMTCRLEVTRFREVAPTVFFPVVVERHLAEADKPSRLLYTATVSNVIVNRALPARTFELRFPAGTTVYNRIEGIQFEIGADGRPASRPEPIPTHDTANSQFAAVPARKSRPPTEREPRLLGSYVLPVSLGVLTLAGIIKCIRLYRARRNGDAAV